MNNFDNRNIFIRKNLEAEAFIKENVTYLRLAGASKIDNFTSPDAYVFIIFERCHGTHTVDFIEYSEKDLQIHISFPRQIHSWNTDESAKGHKLIISKFFFEKFMFDIFFLSTKLNQYPVIDISKNNYDKLAHDLLVLEKELFEKKPNWSIINLRTQLITTTISEIYRKKENKERKLTPLLLNFYNLVDEYFESEKSLSFYAEKLAISPNYLGAQCRKFTGYSAKEIIDQRIILEAKRLLLGTTLSIKEIGYKLNFVDMPRFSTFTKAQTGFTPKQLRSQS